MTMGAKPPAEVSIDRSLVIALLQEQHTDLAHLPLTEIDEGWDNKLFRLGADFVVRVPRRAASAALIEQEQRWLPRLSPMLPLPVPVPIRVGRPGCGFQWSWSVVRLVSWPKCAAHSTRGSCDGSRHSGPIPPRAASTRTSDAPTNPWRGVPLAARAGTVQKHLQQLDGLVDRGAVLDLWGRVLATPPWSGPPMWIHGDLHPGNLLVSEGRLSVVIDFGDLTAGDPATDLSAFWMLLPSYERQTFFTAAREEFDRLDAHTLMRARGWALVLGLAYLADSRDEKAMSALGRATIDRALSDNS